MSCSFVVQAITDDCGEHLQAHPWTLPLPPQTQQQQQLFSAMISPCRQRAFCTPGASGILSAPLQSLMTGPADSLFDSMYPVTYHPHPYDPHQQPQQHCLPNTGHNTATEAAAAAAVNVQRQQLRRQSTGSRRGGGGNGGRGGGRPPRGGGGGRTGGAGGGSDLTDQELLKATALQYITERLGSGTRGVSL